MTLPPVVLFDLDGTLSDSRPGIIASLRAAFAEHGIPPLDPVAEQALLGPPFYESLPPLIGEAALPDVIASYRRHYVDGGAMYDTTAYDGMAEVLADLAAAGVRLAVATSKPEPYAAPIVERLGFADRFETVGGDDEAGTLHTKSLVVGTVLARLGSPGPGDVVMVGDREHDVHGSGAHGIRCIGAGWGYGLPGELAAAGADPICAHPRDLLDALSAGRMAS